ncbi:aminodeoxychorismate lyase [Acinetobacter nectaris]|uniref:aminodeoxychorismate lyase n=1 Tax=Acinetobacter nectaris TaxID=1219382 RepID=UPI001F012876|nr:aminodeoxychorismate lyase [Acinetobacter nectaris]MCF8998265.1 aminodeoxychorismate lyase [Acinetobacter nectaris]MCF9026809.1 aminodeoxychorismate lyase [Acinetobacter nectaris]
MFCFKNGVSVTHTSLLDRAFQYGDGCFTTAYIKNSEIQLWSRHLNRLHQSAECLMLNFDETALEKQLITSLSEIRDFNGTLKIILSRGEGQRGYDFSREKEVDIYLLFFPSHQKATPYSTIAACSILNNKIGITMPNLVGVKSLNRLEQVVLKREATDKGIKEALVLDIQDRIVEGISSNCFLLLNGQWVTPYLGYNGIHGVMRAEILDRMKKSHIICQEREVYIDEVINIQAMFFCNALHPMQAAQKIDNHVLDDQITKQLFDLLKLDQM